MNDRIMFNTKIDAWVLVLLLVAVTICLGGIVQNWPLISGAYWWAGVLLGIGIVLPLWVLLTTRYYLSDSELIARCGPFRWDIPIRDIEAVEPTHNMRSGPSLSLDRLRIDYAGGQRLDISPVPRKAFLQQLEYRRRQVAGSDQLPASS